MYLLLQKSNVSYIQIGWQALKNRQVLFKEAKKEILFQFAINSSFVHTPSCKGSTIFNIIFVLLTVLAIGIGAYLMCFQGEEEAPEVGKEVPLREVVDVANK